MIACFLTKGDEWGLTDSNQQRQSSSQCYCTKQSQLKFILSVQLILQISHEAVKLENEHSERHLRF